MAMPTISIFSIPEISKSLDNAGISQAEILPQKVVMFDELEWYEEALQHQKMDNGTPF